MLNSVGSDHEDPPIPKGGVTDMSYSTVLSTRMSDVNTFAAAFNDWGRDRVLSQGPTAVAMSQTMMGGDRAGEVNFSFQWDSIDAAMEGLVSLNNDSEIMNLYGRCGVTPLRRSLGRSIVERGTTDGKYVSMLMVRSDATDDATSTANTDVSWGNLSAASNGCRWGQVVAGGEFTGMHFMVNWTDSLDLFMIAATANFADPAVQKIMSDYNVHPVARSLSRRL